MPDFLRHVSIHCGAGDEEGHGATVDLSLPVAMTVGELLPWIVDALGAGHVAPPRWQLAHLGGPRLDESATLVQNDVHDGDLLVLAGATEQPPADRSLTTALNAAMLNAASAEVGLPTGLRAAGCLWACALGLVALVWSGLADHGPDRIAVAAAVAVAATTVAVAAPRFGLGPAMVTTLNVAAVAHVAVLGFLVVPAGPAPANVFLGATAAGSLGAALMRVSRCAVETLLAIVTVAAVVAVVTGCAALWPLTPPVLGSLVSALGVALLPLTPRLSIALAGLTPPVPGYPGDEDETPDEDELDADARVSAGHRFLVSLVAGCSASAALGTAILTATSLQRVTAVEVAFTAAVGVALLLRSRSYASGYCRIATSCCGFLSLTATFALVVALDPACGSWTGLLAVGTAVVLVWPITVQSPAVARVAEALEFGALAAVVPLVCWLAGAFDVVQDLGLR
ncbi:type VII secretion integral membrane protein EccD [Mycolicibacterium fortuitum]|uniref:type VII secretion integral membrane protein EccD n=1 Tax=Mycolicibacterium fortuitum TaxID=1766 RepID=UPI001CDBE6AB|nr:type VII secretion integral membrane protein EccD [Mycolicibacterium fortuitum]UBV16613.1 type VII secretion integral membrane protein EccD [Mycolicibacterium fortuitum]